MTGGRPQILVVLAILVIGAGSWILSHLLRSEAPLSGPSRATILWALPAVLAVKALCFHAGGVFRILWPYVAIRDLRLIVRASILSSALLWALNRVALQ